MAGACIILMCVPVFANNYIYYLSLQPQNVQRNLVKQNTRFHVVDSLSWESPDLQETWAYTTMNVTDKVESIDVYIKAGYETALTHEVGHCVSNYAQIPYFWCNQPIYDQIWMAERYNNVMMAQGFDNKIEYFACAYDLYIRFPQMLKRSNPLTYNYIKTVLNYT